MSAFLLHLLRHGAPQHPGLMLGRTDDAPTPDGVADCVTAVAGLGFETLVSSDLRRAREAGRAISAEHACSLAVDARWRELDFGVWDGLAPAHVDASALAAFWDDPDANPPPAGERWSDLTARVGAALAALPPVPTLVVTHGGAIRAALSVLTGFEQPQVWAIDLPYSALLSLRVWPGNAPSAQIVALA